LFTDPFPFLRGKGVVGGEGRNGTPPEGGVLFCGKNKRFWNFLVGKIVTAITKLQ